MKVWKKEDIHQLLDTNEKAVCRALVRLYSLQTESEKATSATRESNNAGFSAFDAEFCSDLARKVQRGYKLSEKQLAVARNKMKRYHRQLCEFANAQEQKKAFNQSTMTDAELENIVLEIEALQ